MFHLATTQQLRSRNLKSIVISQCRRHFISRTSTSQVNLPEDAEVVIIGGGSAGCTSLYHLSHLGVKAVLLEQATLTAGETWHSAGLLWRLRPCDIEIQLRTATRELMSRLKQETGKDSGWINNGSIYVARTKERMDEYHRMATLAKCFGIEAQMLNPEETVSIVPLVDQRVIKGSLQSPMDGIVDPSAFCSALIEVARRNGGQVIERCPVTKIETGQTLLGSRQVTGVVTPYGTIKTNVVVNAAGAWANEIASLAGLRLPVISMKHAYVVSESMADVSSLPNIRDSDANTYFRVKGDSLCMGGFEPNPIILDQMPSSFAFDLFELDWKVFSSHMVNAVDLIPSFETAGIQTTVCGPETYTPDLKPLLGEDPRLKGMFLSCGYNSASIALSGGCGEQVALWIVNGRPGLHMYSCDIRRFTPDQMSNVTWAKERCHESYVKNYAIIYPHDDRLAGRNFTQDPFHEELLVSGAVFEEMQGYERPGWFLHEGYAPVPPYDWYGAYGSTKNTDKRYQNQLKGDYSFGFSEHHDTIGRECIAAREAVVLMDMSYFCKLYMTGPDTQLASDWLFTADTRVPIGRTVYTCLLNKQGGVEADLIVTPISTGSGTHADPIFKSRGMYIVGGGASASQTRAHIYSVIQEKGFRVDIADLSPKIGLLALQGPNSRELLQRVTDCSLDDSEFSFSTARVLRVAGNQVRAMRTSFIGELGWELHVPWQACIPVYTAIWDQAAHFGLRHAGYRALYSLCAEKGYRLWNTDLRITNNPLEAGLGFTCRKKGEYLGKSAVDKARENGVQKRLATFTIKEHTPLWGLEGIWRNNELVGYLQRGEYAYTLGCSIGQGYIMNPEGGTVTTEFLTQGDYQLEVMGKHLNAAVHLKSPLDPENKRLHGIYENAVSVRRGRMV